jgi:hypothetical protein
LWENPLNWWLDADATIPAGFAPWIDSAPAYLAYDLTRALGASNSPRINQYPWNSLNIGTGATGTCDINGVYNSGIINGGTFTGNLSNWNDIYDGTFTGHVYNYSSEIYGGTFTGDVSNSGYIYGGTFTGSQFWNNGFSAFIYGGTFTGSEFINNEGFINDGTFTGSVYNNGGDYNNSHIYGGTFTGSVYNGYNDISGYSGIINGGTFTGSDSSNSGIINGGTFTGSGFTNNMGLINGGTFLPPAISVTTSGSNTLLAMTGGPTFSYPTPPSGGSDQTVARLLNLPWFINL